jgi:hypothetical protein
MRWKQIQERLARSDVSQVADTIDAINDDINADTKWAGIEKGKTAKKKSVEDILYQLGYTANRGISSSEVKLILKRIADDRYARDLALQALEDEEKRKYEEFMSHSVSKGWKHKNGRK